jgi:hypothetical protein
MGGMLLNLPIAIKWRIHKKPPTNLTFNTKFHLQEEIVLLAGG